MPSQRMIERVGAGFVIALVIAAGAFRAGSLTKSGAIAATLVGTATMAAGWGWGTLLVLYFVASTALSRFRREEKERLSGAVVAKMSARDAAQVIANGGMYAGSALAMALSPPSLEVFWGLAALGALAAATADTWATEIGILYGGTPRSLLGFRRIEPGMSGGITVAGCVAMVAGASFVAYMGSALHLGGAASVIVTAGVIGAMTDSVLGATVQQRRRCPSCERNTERRIHDCGAATVHAGGLARMDNDVVNVLATITGAVVAVVALFG